MTACGKVEAGCVCVLETHDSGPHRCACNGSWEVITEPDGSGVFVIHAIPGQASDTHPIAPGEVLDAMFAENGPLPWRFPFDAPTVGERFAKAFRGPIRFIQPPPSLQVGDG